MDKKKYYNLETATKILSSIDAPNWRVWKVYDEDGTIYQNQQIISAPIKLLKLIDKCISPFALYVSSSSFLNPHKFHGLFYNQKQYYNGKHIYPREGYVLGDNILLDSDFFIDIDSPGDLRLAQQDGQKIIESLIGIVKIKQIQFSGNKGIHLLFYHNKVTEPDPIKRIQYYQLQKKMLSSQIEKLNLKTMDKNHYKIMQDITRVYAAPYSIKSNGNIVTPISVDDFMNKDIYDILRSQSLYRASEPVNGDDNKAADVLATSGLGVERSGPSSTFYFQFIDNMVRGLKSNYVTVIEKTKPMTYKQIEDIMKMYNLDSMHEFFFNGIYYYINTQLVQFRRLVKILRKARSNNIYKFLIYKHIFIPVTKATDKDGNVVHEIIRGRSIGSLNNTYTHSKPHSILFDLKKPENISGLANNLGNMKVTITT